MSSFSYDPLGLVSPVPVQSKRILHLLYKEKLDWDYLISEVLVKIWNSFIDCLKLCQSIRVPRYLCMCDEENVTLQIHGISDAFSSV